MKDSVFDYTVTANDGTALSLDSFRGKALLIVNTASKCGFTPQYKGLEELHAAYRDRGLVVLGFPCDQFAHQEPGTDADIAQFCSLNFGVTFPLMKKIDVNGASSNPLFEFLKNKAPGMFGKAVKWNFTKFLVSPDGKTVRRFAPKDEPESLKADIEKLLPL
jgi:glutathione peroxidase